MVAVSMAGACASTEDDDGCVNVTVVRLCVPQFDWVSDYGIRMPFGSRVDLTGHDDPTGSATRSDANTALTVTVAAWDGGKHAIQQG